MTNPFGKRYGPFSAFDFIGADFADIERRVLGNFERERVIVWETIDGRKMTMDEIGDIHMMNIIGLLERRRAEAQFKNDHAKAPLSDEDLIDFEDAHEDEELAGFDRKIEEFTSELEQRKRVRTRTVVNQHLRKPAYFK